mgnify:CR=1 FL=1
MKISQPKLVLNPYEWLPGYGESKVTFRSAGTDLILDIEYDREDSSSCREVFLSMRREIVFIFTRTFIKTPFPYVDIFEHHGDSNGFNLGELTEFSKSEYLDNDLKSWNSFHSSDPPKLRHFNIQFLSENIAFHVLAEDVYLSPEVFIG